MHLLPERTEERAEEKREKAGDALTDADASAERSNTLSLEKWGGAGRAKRASERVFFFSFLVAALHFQEREKESSNTKRFTRAAFGPSSFKHFSLEEICSNNERATS